MRLLFGLSAAIGLCSASGLASQSCLSLGPGPAFDARLCPGDWVDVEETLRWDMEPDRGVSINGTYSYGGGARFTPDASLKVVAILYYLTESADDVLAEVRAESTTAQPGHLLDTTRTTGQGGGVWHRANMPHPPSIETGHDFWACIIIRRHPSGQHPLTLDLGPMVPWRGGYITLPSIGPDWYQLTDPPFWTDRNWDIRACVEYESGVEEVISVGDPPVRCDVAPNPCRVQARIGYAVGSPAHVTLGIYDRAGTLVRTVFDGTTDRGKHVAVWDLKSDRGIRVPAGTYFYRLTLGGRPAAGGIAVVE